MYVIQCSYGLNVIFHRIGDVSIHYHSLPDGRYPLFNQIASWDLSSLDSLGVIWESNATVTFLEIDLFWRWYRYCYCMLWLSFLFLLELLRITIYLIYVCVAKKRVWTPGIWTCVPKLRNFSVAPKRQVLTKKRFSWNDKIFRSDFWVVELFLVRKDPRVIVGCKLKWFFIWWDHAHFRRVDCSKESSSSTTRDWGAKPSSWYNFWWLKSPFPTTWDV